ncbi:E3 ubiquitin/ISG15 ligase TRIM25-like [Pseudophryne corroboree]|uniref:E3 ubiquitin/ISG15 ligase TRIM25-like n=1 Tax=Pseudophryne corroboree TaxID=495146 RepID=UPI0030813BD4
MASADLRQELDCSICLSIYTDPVTLRCGHNFCRSCIDCVLDAQVGSGVYRCPECRAESQERPALEKNRKLCNIAEHVRCIPEKGREEVFCTYCLLSPVPALKSCLNCEASLCDIHWKTHSKSAEHVFIDPITFLENRKCSVHKKVLEYYCTEDSVCICVFCYLIGEHRGHQMVSLDEASDKKKQKLGNVLQNLTVKKVETEKRAQSLQERRREDQRKAADITETVNALFGDIRRQLEDLEKRVQCKISRWEERISLSVSDLIQQLEIKKDELSRKMRHIEELCKMSDPWTVLQDPDTGDFCDTEELCNMSDPVTVLQEPDTGDLCDTEELCNMSDPWTVLQDPDTGDLCDTEELCNMSDPVTVLQEPDTGDLCDTQDTERHDNQVRGAGDLDVGLISGTLHTLSDIITGINTGIYVQQPTDILLDVTTAANDIQISDDLKTTSWSHIYQNHPVTPERFQFNQVISTRGFSSGQHYWEVDVSKSGSWRVGMCYSSIDRSGYKSRIGDNDKSWCLCMRYNNQYSVIHGCREIWLPGNVPCDRVRVYLDYEAGQLSFYSLCDPIRHLHTYTAALTEPLHAALWVWRCCIKISGESGDG